MMYTDDSSLSDNGSDSGNHSAHKYNSSETFHGQQHGFYDMIDDRYCKHEAEITKLVGNINVATTYMDDRSQEHTSLQPLPPPLHDDVEFVDPFLSIVSKGSSSAVLTSKKSLSRMLKVTTRRLADVSTKVKLE